MSDEPLPEPPYPAETKANGYKPEVDWQRINASKTWRLCPERYRPWLLMIWLSAWNELPTGSWEDDDELIAAAIGMDLDDFTAARRYLMRGWVKHSDGRLYHSYVSDMVGEMLSRRRKSTERQRRARDKSSRDVTRDSGVTHASSHVTYAQDQEQDQEQEQEQESSTATQYLSPGKPDDRAAQVKTQDSCPHQEIIRLYLERLPELPRVIPSRWPGSKSERHLRMRWREDARHQSLDFWRRFFEAVRTNPHWMGANDRAWTADLHWLVKRENFDKVIHRLASRAKMEVKNDNSLRK